MVADYPAPGTAAVGGPQVATTRLATALAAHGVQVTVVAPAKGQRPAPTVRVDERVELLEVTVDRRLSLLTGLRTFRRSVGAAARSLGPDIVHAQRLVPFGTAAAEARPLPLVVTARGSTRADTLAAYGGIGAISRAFV